MKRNRLLFSSILVLIMVSILSSVTVFAETTDSWTLKASMNSARRQFQVAEVNGKIYSIGGYRNGAINSVEEYDPSTDKWTIKANMSAARYGHKVAVVNGKIYAIGGYDKNNNSQNTVEAYDPVTDTWAIKARMVNARTFHEVAVVNAKIYVIGGTTSTGSSNSVEEYDPAADKWTLKANMSQGRVYHQVAEVSGKIYVTGGQSSTESIMNIVEEYDPASDKWTIKAPMNYKRVNHQLAVVGDKIYAIGGSGSNGTQSAKNTIEEYDPVTNVWANKASMANSRDFFIAKVINNKIYAIGGRDVITGDNIKYLTAVDEYDPATNVCTPKAPMTTVRGYLWPTEFCVGVVGNTIYAIGGYDTNSTDLSSVEEYALGGTIITPPDNPQPVANSAILELSMTNGTIKEYDLTAAEFQSFLTWYDGRANGTGKAYYIFTKKSSIKPFLSRNEYIAFDKISSFEVKEYAE